MKKVASFSVIAFFLLVSCKKETKTETITYEKLSKVDWLIGEWEHTSSEGFFSEKWKIKNDSTYLGNSFFIIEGDTVFSEEVSLIQQGRDVLYIVNITSESSEQQPTEFKLTSSSENQLVFENPENDFPKKITYNLIHKDSIYAEISGGGKPQGFPMKRKK